MREVPAGTDIIELGVHTILGRTLIEEMERGNG
jgi:hypothetical protein